MGFPSTGRGARQPSMQDKLTKTSVARPVHNKAIVGHSRPAQDIRCAADGHFYGWGRRLPRFGPPCMPTRRRRGPVPTAARICIVTDVRSTQCPAIVSLFSNFAALRGHSSYVLGIVHRFSFDESLDRPLYGFQALGGLDPSLAVQRSSSATAATGALDGEQIRRIFVFGTAM